MPKEIVFNEDEVLNKALDLFWKKGYSGTSMQDLSTVTGLNRSSIYNSFKSKLELYTRVLNIYLERAEILQQRALLNSKNSKDALALYFKLIITSLIEDSDNKGCFLVKSTLEMSQKNTSIKNILEQARENEIRFLEGLVKTAQKEKLINNKQSAKNYADYLYNAAQGLSVIGILLNKQSTLEDIAKIIMHPLNIIK